VEQYRKRAEQSKTQNCSFDVMMGHGVAFTDPLTQKVQTNAPFGIL